MNDKIIDWLIINAILLLVFGLITAIDFIALNKHIDENYQIKDEYVTESYHKSVTMGMSEPYYNIKSVSYYKDGKMVAEYDCCQKHTFDFNLTDGDVNTTITTVYDINNIIYPSIEKKNNITVKHGEWKTVKKIVL